MRRIQYATDFEFFEPYTEHPVTWRATKAPKTIRAQQRPIDVLAGQLRRYHVLVDFHRFVTMIFQIERIVVCGCAGDN